MDRPHANVARSLEEGPHTFTSTRVKAQLYRDKFLHDPSSSQGYPPAMKCDFIHYSYVGESLQSHSEKQKAAIREAFCLGLHDELRDPSLHLELLDARFAQVVQCNFQFSDDGENSIREACRLLSRLPATSLELPHELSGLDSEYFISHRFNPELPRWQDLKMASFIDTNVIRIALIAGSHHWKAIGVVQDLLNDIADLLTAASKLTGSATRDRERDSWFLVRAFLWATWQRGSMLYLHQNCMMHLRFGFNDHNSEERTLHGFSPAPDMSVHEMSKRFAAKGKPAYMCGWAFEILRIDPVAIGLDFRSFHRLFSVAFGDRIGRCFRDHPDACEGDESSKCQRFKGGNIRDQSAHDSACHGSCVRLFWNERSYRSVSGARAVELFENTTEGRLTYCQASGETLAISHVWSHEQGGRVDDEEGQAPKVTGFNACLHRRYVTLAKNLGCNSYWMDTPCIPGAHDLRHEAIMNINKTFEQSRATMISDKDLMAIDATDLTVRTCEIILITLIVCDWNTRAWTFLESFRGRSRIFLLCKDNATVSFKEVVNTVYQKGSIDIAMFLLTIPHALPPDIQGTKDYRELSLKYPSWEPGFMRVEPSGSLLCHRAASRDGDDMVIWSLLLGDKVIDNAEEFWKSRTNKGLSTSFIMSSAPRLASKGLRWAPSSPIAKKQNETSHSPTQRLLAFDGVEGEPGTIVEDGFLAPWLTFTFTGGQMGSNTLPSVIDAITKRRQNHCRINLCRIRRKFLKDYRWGILLRPMRSGAAEGFGRRNDPATNRSDSSKILVAICGTNDMWNFNPFNKDDRIHWVWRGVYEWDNIEHVPDCVETANVLIT